MDKVHTAAEIEARAKCNGLTVRDLCQRAGVAHSTFTRWRAGKTQPTLDVYTRLLDASTGDRAERSASRDAA